MKRQKGITLIALVITIIVMLILVAVTVSVAINGGLIGKAEEAKNRTQAQIEKEQLTSAVLGTLNDDGTVNFERLENGNLPTGFTGSNGTYTSSKGNTFTVNTDGTVGIVQKGIALSQGSLKIAPEATGTLEATLTGGLTGTIEWTSSNEEVATVSDGTVTGVANGTATITASCNGYSASCTVTITESLVGKYISWDSNNDSTNEDWIVLYDDSTNGLQIISKEGFQYNGNNFSLGYNDSLMTESDWNTLIGTDASNLDGDNTSLTDFEKAVYSYNNAITTLNTACSNLITNRTNVIGVRCVGSNPTNPEAENETMYTSENLVSWPTNTPGIGNGVVKSEDENDDSDLDQIFTAGANLTSNEYWCASRIILDDIEFSPVIECGLIKINEYGYTNRTTLIYVRESYVQGDYWSYRLRPVVSLNSNIQFSSGDGSQGNPYIF